jgi:mannose-6-phosphate isomerase
MQPIRLEPNLPRAFYRGSNAIAAFRGMSTQPGEVGQPEDWIASSTTQWGKGPSGLSVLPDGRLLRDAVAADPVAWLGPEHIERHGREPQLLVKLLDAGQRLPVHVHPDRPFAADHLSSPFGKTEAWLIVEAGADAYVHLGFSRDVAADELAGWCAAQQTETMLGATNRISVAPGDSVLVPAGLPHAIGPGILLVELQEPTDFSIFLEWKGFALDGPSEGHLGLGYEVALQCVNRVATGPQRLELLRSNRDPNAFPAEADPFFRAERLRPDPSLTLDPGYSVLIVLDGAGELRGGEIRSPLPIRRGDTILVPYASGAVEIAGDGLSAIRARPPA